VAKRGTLALVLGLVLAAWASSADAKLVTSSSGAIRNWLIMAVPGTGAADKEGIKDDWLDVTTKGKWKETTASTVANGIKPTDKIGVDAKFEVRELAHNADIIDLDAVFEAGVDNNNITAYMLCYVTSATAKTLDMFVGSDDAIGVWVNGKEVHRNPALRGTGRDQDKIVGVALAAGKNAVLLKIVEQGGGWGSFARFSDHAGLKVSSDPSKDGVDAPPLVQAEFIESFIGVMVKNPAAGAAVAASTTDLIAAASGGAMTEESVASKGVKRGTRMGSYTWTEGALLNLTGDNLNPWGQKFQGLSGDINDTTWYGYTAVFSPDDRATEFWVGSDDTIAVWLNGVEVHRNPALRGVTVDQDKAKVNLKRGLNHLLLKVCEQGGGFGVTARFRDADGLAFDSVATAVSPAGKLSTSWAEIKSAR